MQLDLAPLFTLLDALRHPETGCPWDRAQTLASMAKPLQEEADELAQDLHAGAVDGICEETGDVLWNLAAILHIAKEEGLFTPEDVMQTITQKMIGRHPHVFGDKTKTATTIEEAKQAYAAAKAQEK